LSAQNNQLSETDGNIFIVFSFLKSKKQKLIFLWSINAGVPTEFKKEKEKRNTALCCIQQ